MLDIIGPLPESHGMRYLLSIVDRATRFVDALPLAEANANTCSDAFLAQWVSRFGLPDTVVSDNGNTFISQIWTKINENLGNIVSYTPLYHPASLGSLERQHRTLKTSLKAALLQMGDRHGQNWLPMLPWILLGQRTAFQPELGTSAAEMVFGSTPKIPGDLAGADLDLDKDIPSLLERIRQKAARPNVPTAHHSDPIPHLPSAMKNATHVYVRRGKVAPLGPNFDGPCEIVERVGDHCLRVRAGYFANGNPRFELHHWNNVKIGHSRPDQQEYQRPALGRKPKS